VAAEYELFQHHRTLSDCRCTNQNNHQQRITGEEYLAYLRSVVELFDLHVHTYEPVTELVRDQDGFTLITRPISGERRYQARKVVLAIGDMHYPNRLGIPGEDLPHVSHYFHDPHEYFRRRLLIIGGRIRRLRQHYVAGERVYR
jgi:thioredoxin reductase (NADPH)